MTLLLVRHAQSSGNASGTIQGWRDEPLTARGREQAAALAERLGRREPRITALYSSTLARARETAAPLAAALGLEVERRAELREYGYGAAEGLSWAEVEQRFGITLVQWGRGELPGEEGPEAFRGRVLRCFRELAGRHRDGHAAVITHGGVIAAILAHVLGVPDGSWVRMHLPNGSLAEVAPDGDRHALLSLNGHDDLAALTRPRERPGSP